MARKSRKNNAPVPTRRSAARVWRAGLYIRLSVEFNGKRGDSLETQKQIMEAHLALCPDIEIAACYTDNGISGQTFERAAFRQMLEDAEAGKIDCIIVKDLSRLGRSAIDTGYYIEKYFPLHQIRFIAVNDGYDSENTESSGDNLIVPMKNLANEAYAADISKKVRSQTRQAMKDGKYIGARPPYGYKKSPDDCHKLIVNEETAPIVRQIFSWAADGESLQGIAKRLNTSGVTAPGKCHAKLGLIAEDNRLAGSGIWRSANISKILADEVYLGNLVQGKTVSYRKHQASAKPDDWITVCGTHEALIDKDVFDRVQTLREKVVAESKAKKATPFSVNLFRGRIFCGCCGRSLHRQKDNGYYIYHCIANERIRKGACSGKVYLRESELFDMVLDIIRQEAAVVMGNRIRVKTADAKIKAQEKENEREIAKLRQDVASNQMFLTSLYESLANGVLDQKEYCDMKSIYEARISGLMQEITERQKKQDRLNHQVDRYLSLAERLDMLTQDNALSALLVEQVIDRVTVYARESLTVSFAFEQGFDQLQEVLEDE